MGYRVRNADGELSFPSLADVAKAYRNGLVDPDDEVLDERGGGWRKASSILVLRQERAQTERKGPPWRAIVVLALLLAAVWVAAAGHWYTALALALAATLGLSTVAIRAARLKRTPASWPSDRD